MPRGVFWVCFFCMFVCNVVVLCVQPIILDFLGVGASQAVIHKRSL